MNSSNWLVWVYAIYMTLITLGITSHNVNKRKYYKAAYNQATDEGQRLALLWYIRFMTKMINTPLYGLIIQYLILFILAVVIDNSPHSGDSPWLLVGQILGILFSLFFWALYQKSKAGQKTLSDSLLTDGRPPVLFLRSFKMDGLAPAGLFQSFSSYAKKGLTFEIQALGMTVMLGPVIAVAAPERRIGQDIGAARGHFDDWKKEMHHYMREASLILVCPYDSHGLVWEVSEIIKLGYLQKPLLYLANFKVKSGADSTPAFEHFSRLIFDKTGVYTGEYNAVMPYIFFDEKNEPWATNEEFDVPFFRQIFYDQYLVPNSLDSEEAIKNGEIRLGPVSN
jgi:hypothetical protein